jgi:flavin-dependent dehydrogenase
MHAKVDVAVLGDGPAGAVCALSLAESGARVLLLGERRDSAMPERVGQCLPAQGWTWMRALGLADGFTSGPHLTIVANRAAWAADGIHTMDLIRGAHGGSWLLDRPAFDSLLQSAASARGVVHRKTDTRCRVRPSARGWAFELQSGTDASRFEASFAVDASGRQSALSVRRGAKRQVHDRLVGVVQCFTPANEGDRDRTTLVEAVEGGWWYSCRVGNGRRAAIFFTDSDLLPRGRRRWTAYVSDQLASTVYLRDLLSATGYRRVGRAEVVRANSVQLDRPAGSRWIPAGDAAASYDPLSGHGLIAAMDSGRHAAAALVCGARGEASMLRDFLNTATERYEHYLRELCEHYSAQPRWSGTPFWSRRRRSERTHASSSGTAPSLP